VNKGQASCRWRVCVVLRRLPDCRRFYPQINQRWNTGPAASAVTSALLCVWQAPRRARSPMHFAGAACCLERAAGRRQWWRWRGRLERPPTRYGAVLETASSLGVACMSNALELRLLRFAHIDSDVANCLLPSPATLTLPLTDNHLGQPSPHASGRQGLSKHSRPGRRRALLSLFDGQLCSCSRFGFCGQRRRHW
jgi:hypothetical protein